MAQERAMRPERLRVVRGQPAAMPILDLGEGARLYLDLLEQSRHLQDVLDDLRGRLLHAMESNGVDDFHAYGVHVVRQVRHFAPELDAPRAETILEREGRLAEAQNTVLDAEKARRVLDELYAQGKVSREELPYRERHDVQALLVRAVDES